MVDRRLLAPGLVALTLLGMSACLSSPSPNAEHMRDTGAARADAGGSEEKARSQKPRLAASAPMAMAKKSTRGKGMKEQSELSPMEDPAVETEEEADVDEAPVAQKTRSWFPDAFIWEPVIETDASGRAQVPVRVPDTLTDWRVLGLAHDRSGQHAGATTSFATRLPLSADVRLPSFLYVGDRIQIPVRASNGTDAALAATVGLQAGGALSGGSQGTLRIGAAGANVQKAAVVAKRPGLGKIQTFVRGGGHEDAADRTLRVSATGKPVRSHARGVLSPDMALDLPELDGATGYQSVELVVFPGPMALVQAEVDRFTSGARSALPGAALQAVGHLNVLAAKTGATVNEKTSRRLRLIAWQQMVRRLDSASTLQATGMLRAMNGHADTAALDGARSRLLRTVTSAQKPDGTWSSKARSTLQRVLVETACAGRVLPEGSARVKAEGALERSLPSIDDPYTAAVVLGSGLLQGEAAEVPRALLMEAIEHDEDGTPSIAVPDGVVDAWGERPNATAMLAWTVLALEEGEDRGKLAAALMGAWSRSRGFGAGRADPIALAAVVKAVPGASGPTRVSLWSDGAEVSSGTIDPKKPGAPLVLMAEDADAVVKLDPPVSGLAYAATRKGTTPWPEAVPMPGVEWTWEGSELRVGEEGTLTLRLAGPRGTTFVVEQGLPAGMTVDRKKLEAQSNVQWADVQADRVRFGVGGLTGTGDAVELRVTPSFAGTFTTVPLQVEVKGHGTVVQPPRAWTVN